MPRSLQHKPDFKPAENIISQIYMIRGQKVMLDHDLATLYGVETKALNQAVKRNLERFPEEFMFKLTAREWILLRPKVQETSTQFVENEEVTNMRSQFVTACSQIDDNQLIILKRKRNLTQAPYAFTEHGVGMVANFLKSERAVQMSISIIKTFIHLRKHALDFSVLADQLDALKSRQGEYDVQLKYVYDAIENLLDNKIEKEAEMKNRRRIGFKPDA